MFRLRSATIVVMMTSATTALAGERMTTAYGLGLGLGLGTSQGDYTQTISGPMFGGGFDYHSERAMLAFRSASTFDNRSKNSDFMFGFGTPLIKAGIGFIGVATTVPTSPDQQINYSSPFLSALVSTDHARDTSVSVGNTSLYVRLTPVHTNRILFSVDAYYGLHATGGMDVPVRVLGHDAVLVTEPLRAGGAWGGGISMMRRIDSIPGLMWRFEYTYREARLDGEKASIEGDFIGAYGRVGAPDLHFTSQTALLSLVAGSK